MEFSIGPIDTRRMDADVAEKIFGHKVVFYDGIYFDKENLSYPVKRYTEDMNLAMEVVSKITLDWDMSLKKQFLDIVMCTPHHLFLITPRKICEAALFVLSTQNET